MKQFTKCFCTKRLCRIHVCRRCSRVPSSCGSEDWKNIAQTAVERPHDPGGILISSFPQRTRLLHWHCSRAKNAMNFIAEKSQRAKVLTFCRAKDPQMFINFIEQLIKFGQQNVLSAAIPTAAAADEVLLVCCNTGSARMRRSNIKIPQKRNTMAGIGLVAL